MKKSILAALSTAMLLGTFGCKESILDENPQSILVPSFLGTPQGVEAGLVGVYSGLRGVYTNEGGMSMAVVGTDEFMTGIQPESGLDNYNSTLSPLTCAPAIDQWGVIYRYINDANGVIQYAATVQGLDPARVKQVVAEAKLLRAQYYFLLVQYYGDVPLSLDFVSAPTKDIVKAPIASVYMAIVNDLTDAVANLATRPAQAGRVTQATALHLLAKVYLTRASSDAKQSTDYTNAAKFAQQLIDNQSTYGAGLETDPAAVFAEGNENGKEVLFNVQFNGDQTFTGQDPFNYVGANQANFFFRSRYDKLPNMTRDIANGRPYARFCPTPHLAGYQDIYILPGETGKQIHTTDTRFNKWFTTVWKVNSPGANGGRATAVMGDTAAWYPGRDLTATEQARIAIRPGGPFTVYTPGQYTTEYYPVLNKYDDTRRTGLNNPSIRPFIVYRLAETYLIAAEAYFNLGNATAAANLLNVVRERAAATGRKTQMDITPTQVTQDFILDERSRELAGEQTRWLDLVRTKTLVARVQAYTPAVSTRPAGIYGSAAAANIKPFHVLRPIPQPEVDRTLNQPGGGIKQNPGY
ncbi:MAG: RagB/SusD family nutrient uptake outer membrane protein [Janthinobacterium lividum]